MHGSETARMAVCGHHWPAVQACSVSVRLGHDPGKRAVVVDALLAGSLDAERADLLVRRECLGGGAGHVLDEDRMVVGTHRDVPLVRPLQQREHRARGSGLGDLDQVLSPDRGRLAVLPDLRACTDGDMWRAGCERRSR